MSYQFFHCYKGQYSVVFRTKEISRAIAMARTFLATFEQNAIEFHTATLDGKEISITELGRLPGGYHNYMSGQKNKKSKAKREVTLEQRYAECRQRLRDSIERGFV